MVLQMGIGFIKRKCGAQSDVIIGLFWSLGIGACDCFYCIYAWISARLNLLSFWEHLICNKSGPLFNAYIDNYSSFCNNCVAYCPAATAGIFSSKLKNRMIYAIIFGIIFCVAGLWISYVLNIASGAIIVILSVVFYFSMYAISYTRIKAIYPLCTGRSKL